MTFFLFYFFFLKKNPVGCLFIGPLLLLPSFLAPCCRSAISRSIPSSLRGAAGVPITNLRGLLPLHPCHPPLPHLHHPRSAQQGFKVAECASEDSPPPPNPNMLHPSSVYLLPHHVFLVTVCRWCCVSKWIMCIALFHSQAFPSFRKKKRNRATLLKRRFCPNLVRTRRRAALSQISLHAHFKGGFST